MRKIQFCIEYREKTYYSDVTELTNEEFEQMDEFLKQIISGKSSYFTIEKNGKKIYFPPQVIELSVISIETIQNEN